MPASVKLFVDGEKEPVARYDFVTIDTINEDEDGTLFFTTIDNREVQTNLMYIAEWPESENK